MWAVGSIGIVIEKGDWAGFGPMKGMGCCFKHHATVFVTRCLIKLINLQIWVIKAIDIESL